MSVFEQLRPFVSLCQACGLIPYTIENNLNTNKFARFTFSFRHRTTWWFFLILILQLVVVIGIMYLALTRVDDLAEQNMPITISILFIISWFIFLDQFFQSRWIMLHYRKLRKAVEAVLEVERLFGENMIAQYRTSAITTRIVMGSILIVTAVSIRANNTSF
jgi:gustatory receptor